MLTTNNIDYCNVNFTNIKRVHSTKYLGIIFDDHFKWVHLILKF